jgi:PKD repeat protein
MTVSSQLLVSPTRTIRLTATILAVAIILFVANVTIANAQQQQPPPPQQPLTNQMTMTQNRTELFQSAEDGIKFNVPQGWQIHDLNNIGPVFAEESTRGFGILAQLCLSEEEQQQRGGATTAAGNGSSNTNGCQAAQEEVIHIVRYLNLDGGGIQGVNNNNSTTASTPPNTGASFDTNTNRTTTVAAAPSATIDDISTYHLQKLQEVGYNNIQIVNNEDTRVNLTRAHTNQTVTTLPAKFVEITYTTASSATDEIKRGYFILTATNATSPNLGITKGYSVFYEGSSVSSAEAGSQGSMASTPFPEPVRQVFDSFELITTVTSTEPLAVDINSRSIEGEGVAPATFEFEADVRGGAEPYTYGWDFGEDESGESNEQLVSHTFDEAGSYNVELSVTDSGGQSASDSREITIEEAPEEEEEEEEEEVQSPQTEEDNNSGSDSVDIEGRVDDFIDDLFGRLGIR